MTAVVMLVVYEDTNLILYYARDDDLYGSYIHTQVCNYEHAPLQKHNCVQFKFDARHLQGILQPFLQPQWISSLHDFEASPRDVQYGFQMSPSLCYPQSSVHGNCGRALKVCDQQ